MFKKAYIPRTLNEVNNYERDVDLMQNLKEEEMSLNTQQDNVSNNGKFFRFTENEFTVIIFRDSTFLFCETHT